MDNTRGLVVCIWLSVALFPLLLYSVLWVQGLFSISISLSSSLPPPPLSALPDSTINPPTHIFAHTHTYTHQSIQACLALPKPKMTIDFLSTLPLNYANLWFMFRFFFGIPTPDTGWGFPLRQGGKDTGVGSRRKAFGQHKQTLVWYTIIAKCILL